MSDRRDYGTGSIYQRQSDWRWIATLEGGWTGNTTRRRIVVSAKGCEGGCKPRCHHRADINRKLRDKRLAIEKGGQSTASARTTVKAWSEQWLTITERTLRPKPWATNRSAIRKWIVPTIGHKRLDALTPTDIRAVTQAQRDAGRSTSTAHRTHVTLATMLRAAILEGHAVPAHVLEVPAPALAVNDRDAMTIAETLAVLLRASELPHGSRWAMTLLVGTRQAEALGLTWDAIDLDTGRVIVEWQLQPLPYIDRKNKTLGFRVPDGYDVRHLTGAYHLVRPKTKKGFRVFDLPPAMVEALRDWQPSCPANPYGLVWPTSDGQPRSDKADRQEWYDLQKAAGVAHPAGRYYYTHEARHATATNLKELGVDEHDITAIMGHSSIITSRAYMHGRSETRREALEGMAKLLQLSAQEPEPPELES